MKYFLFFLLLLTGTIYHEIPLGQISIGFIDIIWLPIVIFAFIKLLSRNVYLPKKFTKIFLILLGYYALLSVYSYYSGATINEIGGRLRNLYAYPLMFFAGYILTVKEKDIGVYFKLIKIYIIIAFALGAAKTFNPSLNTLLLYRGIDATDYFMVVQFGTGLLAGLALIHQLFLCILRKGAKIKDVILILIFVLSIVGTLNRSVNISVFASVLITIAYMAKYYGKSKNIVRMAVLITFVGGVIIFNISLWFVETAFYQVNIYDRINKATVPIIGYDNYLNRSISTRLARVGTGLSIWLKEAPITGRGWGGFGAVNYVDPISGTYIYTLYNSAFMSYYVDTLARTGIIGFVIIMVFWWNVFKALRQSTSSQKINIEVFSILMYLFTCMIYSTVNYNLNGDSPFIALSFYVFGIGVGYNERFGNKCDNKQ